MRQEPVLESYELQERVRLSLLRGFIPKLERAGLMSLLLRESPFEQRSIRLFGREVMQPRLISWAGELPYRYSGDTLPPRPFSKGASATLHQVNQILQELSPGAPAFNHVLMNLYRDGSDSMGAHADDEVELGPDPFIASLSLGCERKFRVRPKKKLKSRASDASASESATSLDVQLQGGDLLIMHAPMQRHYLHSVPKERRAEGPRLNLTFRAVLR